MTRSLLLTRSPIVFCLLLTGLLCAAMLPGAQANTLPPSAAVNSRADQISDRELRHFLQHAMESSAVELDKYDAEVWLESMLSRMEIYQLEKDEALQILKAVYREASVSQLEPDLVLAVIAIESSFNRFAVSSAGAQGLMQVMPFWKNEIGRPLDNLTNIDTNIRYGCRILQYYLQKSNGRLSEALARYNGSYGRTFYPEKVLVAWERTWQGGRVESMASATE